MKKLDIQNLDYNNTKIFEKTLINEKNQLEKKVETLENKNETLEKENEILKQQQENFIKNFKDFKFKFEEIEQENQEYKKFILEKNLGQNFENFKQKKEDNNFLFNFRN